MRRQLKARSDLTPNRAVAFKLHEREDVAQFRTFCRKLVEGIRCIPIKGHKTGRTSFIAIISLVSAR